MSQGLRQMEKWIVRRFGVVLLITGTIISLVFGYLGFSKLGAVGGYDLSGWDRIYLTLQLFIGQSGYLATPIPWELEVARFLAPLVAGYAAVGALVLVFYERYRQFWAMLTYRDHDVICGLDAIGYLLAIRLMEAGRRVIIIEPDGDHKNIAPARDLGAVVLVGNPTDPAVLRRARVQLADTVIAACESDGINSDIAFQAGRLATPGRTLKCFAHVMNRYLCHYLMGQAITTQTSEYFQLEFFNIYDSGARLLLSRDAFGKFLPEDRPPHVVILGLGQLGESLVVRAERLWRARAARNAPKLRISLLDTQASQRLEMLKMEYPFLEQTCEIMTYDLDIQSPGFLQQWPPFGQSEMDEIGKFYICLDDDTTALTVAFLLQQRSRRYGIPIVVMLNQYNGLAKSIGWRRDEELDRGEMEDSSLLVFGLLDQTCRMHILGEGIYEDLAIAIHQAFQKSEAQNGRSLEDAEMVPWYPQPGRAGLAEKYKEDNRRQARSIGRRLWSEGYGIEPLDCVENSCFAFNDELLILDSANGWSESELERLARLEHEDWMAERIRQGWKPGPVRNREGMVHDLLYDWHDELLKEEARQKTRQMIREWPGLLAQVDLQIYRRKSRG